MNEKERLILKLLAKNPNDFITSQELAVDLFVSDRTIRNYIKRIKEQVSENGGELIAKQGQGYQLQILNQKEFQDFYHKEIIDSVLTKKGSALYETKERQYYILSHLFFESKTQTIEDFSNEIFVSCSTLTNDLIEIRKLLTKYKLSLSNKVKTGIKVVGDERQKRNFMMNYFFMNRLYDHFHMFSAYESLLGELPINEILLIVLDECRETNLPITDFIVSNIVLHIALAMKRLESGFVVEQNLFEIDQNSEEYQVALRIIHRLKESTKVEFPPEEANYIAIHLQNKLATKQIFQKMNYTEKEIKNQLLEALNQFDRDAGFNFVEDTTLINGLMQHFTPLLARLQNQNYIQNPLLKEIKQKYQQILDLTIAIFSKMSIFKTYQINEEEWAYIAIHVIAAVERYFNNQKAKVLVICATGLGSSQILKMRIENELGSKVIVEQVLGFYEINWEEVAEIDLIISTIAMPEDDYAVPIVQVSVFLGDEDIRKINYELSRIKGLGKVRQRLILESNESKQEKLALIERCFHENLFIHLDKKMNKKQVLEILANKISDFEKKDISNDLLHQLDEREKYGSVVFSSEFAVPHPLEAVTNRALVAIAVAPKGIYWDDTNQKVQLVLLSSPDKKNSVRIERLNQLFVSIIEDPIFCEDLVTSPTYTKWREAFINYNI
ncbi:BglG family transcription antiterminator [Enterococcus sp.]|uniref:BglG family transcription antiterminator n=1 Tax=Enterococcus sp. TaxID=35783 RepID=UPI002FC70C96